jgi:hypothetical protein
LVQPSPFFGGQFRFGIEQQGCRSYAGKPISTARKSIKPNFSLTDHNISALKVAVEKSVSGAWKGKWLNAEIVSKACSSIRPVPFSKVILKIVQIHNIDWWSNTFLG